MAWSAPFNYVPGQVLTAANLDTYLSGNMNETAVAKVTTAGDMVYATGANALARLALGASGRALRAGASAPEYTPVGTLLGFTARGDLVVASASGQSTVLAKGAEGTILR